MLTRPVMVVMVLLLISAQHARSLPLELRMAEVVHLAQECDRAQADLVMAGQQVERARADWRNLMAAAQYFDPVTMAAAVDEVNNRGSYWATRLAVGYSAWSDLQGRFQVSLATLLVDLQKSAGRIVAPPPAVQQPQPSDSDKAYILGVLAFQKYKESTGNLVQGCLGGNEEACGVVRSRSSQNEAFIRHVDGLAANRFMWNNTMGAVDMLNEPSRHDSGQE